MAEPTPEIVILHGPEHDGARFRRVNQHRRIKGYRELTEDEIALMNDIKETGETLEALVSRSRATEDIDQRWVSISATDLQTGLMALTRAVARPTSF